jgi:hypothetical protein
MPSGLLTSGTVTTILHETGHSFACISWVMRGTAKAMLDDASSERLFREYESELDAHHEQLSLWGRAREVAVYAALAAFDMHYMCHLHGTLDASQVPRHQQLKRIEDGLSQAIRWLCRSRLPSDVIPTDDEDLISEALGFIRHAASYSEIADQYRAVGRGVCTYTVDPGSRTVSFEPKRIPGGTDLGEGQLELVEALEDPRRVSHLATKADVLGKAFALCRTAKHRCEDGRIVLEDPSVLRLPEVRAYVDLGTAWNKLLLPDDCDLMGFRLCDLDAFWHALRRWGHCCMVLSSRLATEEILLHQCLPTQVLDREAFIEMMSSLSGLDIVVVRDISARVSYDPAISNPDVVLQPLVSAGGRVAWSPSLVAISTYRRNTLRLMTRNPRFKAAADNIVGLRHQALLQELGQWLSRRGYQFAIERKLAYEGEETDLDLLAYLTSCPNEVLLVEAKAMLSPDEVNEVHQATQDMIDGQGQLRRAENILRNMAPEDKRRTYRFVNWAKVNRYLPIVVSAEAEPDPAYDHTEIPGISFVALKHRLQSKHYRRPSRLWQACVDREWLRDQRRWEPEHKSYRVGTVTFALPIRVKSNET